MKPKNAGQASLPFEAAAAAPAAAPAAPSPQAEATASSGDAAAAVPVEPHRGARSGEGPTLVVGAALAAEIEPQLRPRPVEVPVERDARLAVPSPSEPDPAPDPRRSPSGFLDRSLGGYLPEVLLFAAAILVLGVGLSSVPLLDPDEARYASASRAMLERGDLVVPYFNGAERLNKPALFYWLQAASFRLFGASAGAARLPSAVAALAIVIAVFVFARRTFGRSAARRSGLILLTIPLFAVVGKTGITDMTLAAFTVGALLLWYRLHVGDAGTEDDGPAASSTPTPMGTTPSPRPAVVRIGARARAGAGAGVGVGSDAGMGAGRRRLLWLGVSLCLGLAFLVKGPPGILVPCFVIACYLALRGEWSGFRARGILLGGVVAAAVFLPWVVLLIYRLGTESRAAAPGSSLMSVLWGGLGRVGELLQRETIERTLHGLDHPQPLHYYWVASLIIFFPWIAWVPSAISRAWPRLRRREPAALYLVTWLIGVLVFFTAIRGKLITYILPAAPAMALLLGREWARVKEDGGREARWVSAGSIVLVAGIIGLVGYEAVMTPPWLTGYFAATGVIALAFALAAAVPLFMRRPAIVDGAVASVMAMVIVAFPLVAGHELGEKRSFEHLARDASLRDHPWSRVLAYKMFRPSLVFYGGRDVTYVDEPWALHDALTPECLVVLDQRRFDELPPAWQSALRTVAAQDTVIAVTPVTLLPPANGPAR